ncbi:MAG: hypothetical protein ACRETX_13150, partial [Steroidobacteraceae bacterium]
MPLATTAGAFVRIEGWRALSFDSARDYLRERLDRTGSWLTDLATLEKTMARSPSFRAALLGGDGEPALGQVAALAVARVATPQTMSGWIARARAVSVRELLDDVRRFKAEQARGRSRSAAGASNCFARPSPAAADASNPEPDPDPADDGERCQVRIPVAEFVIGVFDELRDIFGAVNGRDAGPAA